MFGIGSVLSSVAPAVASAVGNLASSVVNSFYNKKAASKQNKYTYSLIDYENQYNLPVNQRARLEEAGYNPNLALNGVNVQSATGSAPTVQPARVNFDLLQAYNMEQQNKLLQAQRNLLNKQTDLTNENAKLSINNSLLTQERMLEIRKKNDLANYNLDYAEAEHDNFLRTGKIPESYYKTGGILGQFFGAMDRGIQISQ